MAPRMLEGSEVPLDDIVSWSQGDTRDQSDVEEPIVEA